MDIEVILKETAEEYNERQGKASTLSKHLAANFDLVYIGEELKQPDNLSLSYNPVMDLFEEKKSDVGLGQKATTQNTRFTVLVSPPDFEEVANNLTMITKDQGDALDNLLDISGQALNISYDKNSVYFYGKKIDGISPKGFKIVDLAVNSGDSVTFALLTDSKNLYSPS